jgi:hypothetical protein
MDKEIDDIEELKRWIATVVQNAGKVDAKRLKQALEAMLVGAGQIGDILSSRCSPLSRQCRPRKAKPPQASPVSGPQKQKNQPSSTDTPKAQNDTEDQSQTKPRIMQGAYQADPSLADQQRALWSQIYGTQNPEVAFRKVAKAIAR